MIKAIAHGKAEPIKACMCAVRPPYSFRHRYAKGMHANNIPIANISEAMGHTIEVHLKSYARFKPNATADLVAAVNV